MNLHKYYLQSDMEALDAAEKKFDFIPDLTNRAAIRSLDKICQDKTREICRLRKEDKDSRAIEKMLEEYRNYAIRHYEKP